MATSITIANRSLRMKLVRGKCLTLLFTNIAAPGALPIRSYINLHDPHDNPRMQPPINHSSWTRARLTLQTTLHRVVDAPLAWCWFAWNTLMALGSLLQRFADKATCLSPPRIIASDSLRQPGRTAQHEVPLRVVYARRWLWAWTGLGASARCGFRG